jgi:hypothetical protein
MANVLSRLTTTFNSSNFGDDIILSDRAKAFLNTGPIKISSWAASDLANGAVTRSDYFQNPVASYVSSISSNLNSIITLCTSDPANNYPSSTAAVQNLANSSNNLVTQLNLFLQHTNRISGVSESFVDVSTGTIKPNYQDCVGTGGMLLTILGTTDNVRNSSPILNNFTSLYIENELTSNNWSIGNTKNSLQTVPSSLTTSEVNAMNVIINTANTLLYTRRTEDENYFYTSQQILRDFQILNGLQNSGSTEKNLITNKIGTTKLKTSLGVE